MEARFVRCFGVGEGNGDEGVCCGESTRGELGGDRLWGEGGGLHCAFACLKDGAPPDEAGGDVGDVGVGDTEACDSGLRRYLMNGEVLR